MNKKYSEEEIFQMSLLVFSVILILFFLLISNYNSEEKYEAQIKSEGKSHFATIYNITKNLNNSSVYSLDTFYYLDYKFEYEDSLYVQFQRIDDRSQNMIYVEQCVEDQKCIGKQYRIRFLNLNNVNIYLDEPVSY